MSIVLAESSATSWPCKRLGMWAGEPGGRTDSDSACGRIKFTFDRHGHSNSEPTPFVDLCDQKAPRGRQLLSHSRLRGQAPRSISGPDARGKHDSGAPSKIVKLADAGPAGSQASRPMRGDEIPHIGTDFVVKNRKAPSSASSGPIALHVYHMMNIAERRFLQRQLRSCSRHRYSRWTGPGQTGQDIEIVAVSTSPPNDSRKKITHIADRRWPSPAAVRRRCSFSPFRDLHRPSSTAPILS